MRYYKTQAITNFSFYIVYYLLQRVTEVMILYLAYIRPFTTMLYYQRKLNVRDIGYIFYSDRSLDKC
jgi:hypothetical protein